MKPQNARRLLGVVHRGILPALVGLVLAITLASASQAETLLRADRTWSEEQGWKVYWSAAEEACFAEQLQTSGTTVLLGMLGKDNLLVVGFQNDKLGFAKRDKAYELKLNFDGRSSWNSRMSLMESGGDRQVLHGLYQDAASFRTQIAKAEKLTVQFGKKTLAAISLKGSSTAFKALDACVIAMRSGSGTPDAAGDVDRAALTEADKLQRDAIALLKARKYAEAEPLYRRALAIREKALGPEHLGVAASLNHLALLLWRKGDLVGAEPLYQRALAIREKALGVEHLEVAASLNNLAGLLADKGDRVGAEPLHRRALAIREKALGPEHLGVAASLNHLALLLWRKGDLVGTEPLYRRALAIREKALGPEHLGVAASLNNLALLLWRKGDLVGAEPLYRRALAIREKALGPEHSDVALSLNGLAGLLADKGDRVGAEPLHRRALAIREKALGPEHSDVAASLNNLAGLLADKGDQVGAEPLHRRALAIQEKVLGVEHPDVATSLYNLARLFEAKRDLAGAEPLHRRALAIREKALGPEHSDVALSLNGLAGLLADKGDRVGAESLYRRALAIQEKALGPEHSGVAVILNNLAGLLADKGDRVGAEPLHRRALAIQEKALGPEHPFVAASLNNLALLLRRKEDLVGAESLQRRALAILEKALGPEHPEVAINLNNLAKLFMQKRDVGGSLGWVRRAAKAGYPERGIYLHALLTNGAERPETIAESFEVVQQTMSSEAGAALRSLALRVSVGDGLLAGLVRAEQDLAGELIKLESAILAEVSKEPAARSKTKEAAIRERTVAMTAKLSVSRELLAREFPDYVQLSRPSNLSLADAQQLLANDEALIVVDIADKSNGNDYVWAVTRQSSAWNRLNSQVGQIAEVVAKLRTGLDLTQGGRAAIDAAKAYELYKQLLGPVEGMIRDKAHLMFVLNGPVSSLPPQVLVTEPSVNRDDLRTIAWLVRNHSITIFPTVSSLKLLRQRGGLARAPKPLRGYGDPVFDATREGELRVAARGYRAYFGDKLADVEVLRAGLPRLPGTARELKAVARSLGVPESEIVLRERASETSIKQAKLDDYNILYFATHGLVAGEVETIAKATAEPALAFTIPDSASERDDGLLTASEVAELKINAEWVVLSACNTAAEGKPGAGALSGLARAFFYAGARSLLVSHWVVDDEATAELMSRTFANAASNPGRRQAEALRQAMLSVMNDPDHPEWADPGYWAPFVLVGEAR